MNLIGLSLRGCFGAFLRSEQLTKINAPHSFSVFAVPRIFSSQNLTGDADANEFDSVLHKRSAIETFSNSLRDLFQCTQDEIKCMVKKYPSLVRTYRDVIVSNAKCLKENGLIKSNLVAHAWVLQYNPQLFPSALELLKVFHHDVNVNLPFLMIPYKKLLHLAKGRESSCNTQEKSKIEWLSDLLECDEQELSRVLLKHYYILGMPRERILYVFNILKEGGVPLESIVKDICIFKHNSEVMKQRLTEAQEKHVGPLKPWSLRSSQSTFERTIERKVKAREVLGNHKSVKDYISTRLQCDEETLSFIFSRIPQMKHISVLKVKEILDFLYEAGYSPEDVCQTPRILTRSLRTVKSRMEELKLLGLTHPNFLVLCKTSKEYKELIVKLKGNY